MQHLERDAQHYAIPYSHTCVLGCVAYLIANVEDLQELATALV